MQEEGQLRPAAAVKDRFPSHEQSDAKAAEPKEPPSHTRPEQKGQ